MLNSRKRLIPVLSGCAMIAAVGFMPSTPAQADPDIDDVQARVNQLYRQAEQASERYNDARLQLKDLRSDLSSLKADQRRQDRRLEAVRQQVEDTIVRQYQGESLSAIGEVVVSKDPKSFLAQLSTMSAFDDMQDRQFEDYKTQARALDIRRDATERRVAKLADVRQELAQEKSTVEHKLAEAKDLLGHLKAKQREAVASRSVSRVPAPTSVPASGRAAAAVQYALAQVGDAYVWGAAGPSAFDCSGLTMMAWAQAGVALPHSSSAQYNSGPHVASGDLQPGDLVFYYSPISHVGIYIGNGMIVHAANPSAGVTTAPVFSMPYSGAVRPG